MVKSLNQHNPKHLILGIENSRTRSDFGGEDLEVEGRVPIVFEEEYLAGKESIAIVNETHVAGFINLGAINGCG